ncbi:uncharacterized protein [Porites lutea]|uniref:uncharacterized protein n=1 Tax=Porites lutea TaxID=51062 RepID=UPI003CC5B5CF
MGRIFSVMATLIGLVSIAVLLGNLTTSLTTDIVFSDIKLYGSKVAAIHNSSEFRLGLRKNAKMNPGREYRNLDEVYEALLSREVDGALIDALIAGSREDLFNSSGLRIYQTFQHSSVYGMVLAGETKKLQQCFEKFMKENSAMISAHVASKTSVIKPSSKSAAVEQAMSLFDPSNNLFQDALWRCLISLAFLTVCGLTWEIIRATRTSRMRRVHQDRQLNCSSMKVRSEMEKIVNEFYKSTKGTFEQLSARHIQERKQFFIRRENQRRSHFYSWS